MKFINYLLSVLIISMGFCLLGCGGGGNDGDISLQESSDIISSVTGKVVNGSFIAPAPTASGMRIVADDDAFADNSEINILERKFYGEGTPLLTNTASIYDISGVCVENGISKKIGSLVKPIVVILPNTFGSETSKFYAGIRDNANSEWRFSLVSSDNSINNPQGLSSFRYSLTNKEFYVLTDKIGIQIALFADNNSGTISNASVVEGVDMIILPENATDTKKTGLVDIIDNKYAANLLCSLKLYGKNLSALTTDDYVLTISYSNKNFVYEEKSVFGNSATLLDTEKGSNNDYIHKVIIKDLSLKSDTLSFRLNTKGIEIGQFPQNFIISLKDNGKKTDLLPFEYVRYMELKNSYVPVPIPAPDPTPVPKPDPEPDPEPDPTKIAMPRNLIVSHTRISTHGSVTISWDSGNPAIEGMTYDVMVAFGDASETLAVGSLSETIFKLEGDSQPFEVGTYSVRVIARNASGVSLSTGKIYFSTVDISLDEPVLAKFKPYYLLGENVEASWSAVYDPLGVPVVYSVWFWNETQEIPTSANYMGYETKYTVRNLATGTYKFKVTATNGANEVESGTIEQFRVIATTTSNIQIDRKYITDNGFYARDSQFEIVFSENNFDEQSICDAITVEGIEVSNVKKDLKGNILYLSFVGLLESNKEYSVSMASVKDIYGLDVVTFEKFDFKTFVFDGNGTEQAPYKWQKKPEALDPIPENMISLIGSLSVDVSDILSAFNGIVLSNTASVVSNDEVLWTSLNIVKDENKIILGIGNEDFWPANKDLNLKVSFSGLHNGKTIYFETSENEITVENGDSITIGEGTDEKPFLVYTSKQLDRVRDNLDASYRQLRNIELKDFDSESVSEGNGWLPIGEYFEDGTANAFNGCYDGCNHIISNMKIVSGLYGVGLFGAVGGKVDQNFKSVVLSNVILKDFYIESTYEAEDFVDFAPCAGGLAAAAIDNVQIKNCHGNGIIKAHDGTVGGLVGSLYGRHYSCLFEDSSFEGSINFSGYGLSAYIGIGGCIGEAYNASISNCTAKVNICDEIEYDDESGNLGESIGGLVGSHCYGFLSDCKVIDSSISGNMYIGGLSGSVDEVDINSCSVECNSIIGKYNDVAGFIASLRGNVKNSETRCISIEGYARVAGFSSNASNCSIENCSSVVSDYIKANTDLQQSTSASGFVSHASCNMKNCSAKSGSIISYSEFCGGFVGYFECSMGDYAYSIDNCSCETGHISARSWSGGFAGNIRGGIGHVANCHSVTGDIIATKLLVSEAYIGLYPDTSRVGGFVGDSTSNAKIANCWSEIGSVSGEADYVGGFVGESEYGSYYINCYAKGGNVSGQNSTGGFVGSGSAILNNCYTSCDVTSRLPYTGQFAAYLSSDSEVNNCFTLDKASDLPLVYCNDGSLTNSVADSEGYNSSFEWDDKYWNLTSTSGSNLPTLKDVPFDVSEFPEFLEP